MEDTFIARSIDSFKDRRFRNILILTILLFIFFTWNIQCMSVYTSCYVTGISLRSAWKAYACDPSMYFIPLLRYLDKNPYLDTSLLIFIYLIYKDFIRYIHLTIHSTYICTYNIHNKQHFCDTRVSHCVSHKR